jgi:hypothetical protein
MDTNTRRFLTANALLLTALGFVLAFGAAWPATKAEVRDGFVFTLDRGGVLRFNNGKVDVETAYNFTLDGDSRQIPNYIDTWAGIDFPLNVAAVESIRPELLINRLYRNQARQEVYLTVIGANTSRKLHRPEICYRAADWTLTQQPVHTVTLDSGQVGIGQMLARSNMLDEQRVILYWYLWRDSRRRIEDGAYVIQVASPIRGSTEQAVAVADSFVRQILRRTVGGNSLALRLPFLSPAS